MSDTSINHATPDATNEWLIHTERETRASTSTTLLHWLGNRCHDRWTGRATTSFWGEHYQKCLWNLRVWHLSSVACIWWRARGGMLQAASGFSERGDSMFTLVARRRNSKVYLQCGKYYTTYRYSMGNKLKTTKQTTKKVRRLNLLLNEIFLTDHDDIIA